MDVTQMRQLFDILVLSLGVSVLFFFLRLERRRVLFTSLILRFL